MKILIHNATLKKLPHKSCDFFACQTICLDIVALESIEPPFGLIFIDYEACKGKAKARDKLQA